MQRIVQFVFWLAVATTLYLCLRPPIIMVPTSDKTQHLLTFGGLVLLAAAAYPRRPFWLEGLALSGFGALIEIIQPYFGRDRDVRDWMADTLGILIALIIAWAVRKLLLRERNSLR